MNSLAVAKTELIIGGQRSGKSRRAEALAQHWLEESPERTAVLIATATAWDDEMRHRIATHQDDRRTRVPAMMTVEEPLHLAQLVNDRSQQDCMLVIDCMTLWLTNWSSNETHSARLQDEIDKLLYAIDRASSPIVLVSNEIGLGVIPLGQEVRAFVDALGRLNQRLAAHCNRVTLMAAGLPVFLKDIKK